MVDGSRSNRGEGPEEKLSQRLFTIEEANELVPQLEITVARLVRLRAGLADVIGSMTLDADLDPKDVTVSMILERRPDLAPTFDELQHLLEQVEAVGVQVKGLELGLVDFPAEIDGRVVLLCWQLGEREVTHYHELDTGFAGRRPLDGVVAKPSYLN